MDPVGMYGAALSTVIAVVGAGRFIYLKWSERRERKKVHVVNGPNAVVDFFETDRRLLERIGDEQQALPETDSPAG